MLKQEKIWARIVNKKSIEYLPAIVLVGSNPSDDRNEIKKSYFRELTRKG